MTLSLEGVGIVAHGTVTNPEDDEATSEEEAIKAESEEDQE